MASTSFEKSVRSFIADARIRNNGMIFYDNTDARGLCKLVYYGWLKPIMHGQKGMYALFLKTKHIQDPEQRALEIAQHMDRPWTFDVFWDIFLNLLNEKSHRTSDKIYNLGRSLVDNEIPGIIEALEKIRHQKDLSWFTPHLMEALMEMRAEDITFQAECDRADEAMRRAEKKIE